MLLLLYLCARALHVDTASAPLWNAFFWVVVLFSSLQLTAHKSLEKQGEGLFYHLMASSAQLVLARVFYHFLVLLGFSVLIVGGYFLLMGNPLKQPFFFLFALLSYWMNVAILLSMVGFLNTQSANSPLLHSTLGLPLLIPSLLLYLPITQATLYGMTAWEQWRASASIISLNVLYVSLGAVLFPHLRGV